ncbi:uncharacterized protein LOC143508485 isoform X2 [Brachyhypopomus gauderio]
MSVTIDYSQLTQGEDAVKSLSEKFPGLRVHFLRQQRQCSLHGPFSEVQSVVSHLMELFGNPDALEENGSSYEGDRNQSSGNNHGDIQHQGEARPADHTHGLLWKNPSNERTNLDFSPTRTRTTEERKDWTEELGVEDLSLIMEADVFAYLHTRSKAYRHILDSHGVYVVDVTSEGVTTLYLQSDANAKTESDTEKRLRQAREELSCLYHQLEGNLRRAQIRRSALSLRGGDTAAFKDLQSLLPKVLLSYDQTHVYVVGESSEVSQAKQILLLGSRDEQWLNGTPKNDTSRSSTPPNPDAPAPQVETPQAGEFTGSITAATPKMTVSGAEHRGRGREEYKLAARFKKSDTRFLGFSPGESRRAKELRDLTLGMNPKTLTSNSRPTLPPEASLGTAGTVNDEKAGPSQISAPYTGVLQPIGASHTGDDILYQNTGRQMFTNTSKTCEPLSSRVSKTCSTKSTSTLTPAVKAPPSTSVNALSGLDKQTKAPIQAALGTFSTPRPSLRRSNSFSGRSSQKQETQKTGLNKKPSHHLKKTRSSSFKSGEQGDERSCCVVSSDIIVSAVMWNYMKVAYESRLAALVSDLQVSECPAGTREVRVNLKGSEASKVGDCQHELQRLVGMIASDFSVQELHLSDPGGTAGSEVLEACCSNIRSRFSKICLRNVKDKVLLTGPKLLCAQVTDMLREVFPNLVTDPSQATAVIETLFQCNDHITPSQMKVDTECREGYQTGGHRASQSPFWSSGIKSPKQNPVVKEMLKKGGPTNLEGGKVDMLPSQSSLASSSAPALTAHKKENTTPLTSKPSTSLVGNYSEPSECGGRGLPVAQTSEMFLGPHYLPLVCPTVKTPGEPSHDMWACRLKEAQTTEKLTGKETCKGPPQVRGIQGTMKCVKIPQSLSGHEPYPTARITYHIPDGIQGEGHPNPGSPFQGGIFDAYLPMSAKELDLLHSLEKAFKQGLTFTIHPGDTEGYRGARVVWNRIPHKMNMEGGRSGNGYPDSTYLNDLAEVLMAGRTDKD